MLDIAINGTQSPLVSAVATVLIESSVPVSEYQLLQKLSHQTELANLDKSCADQPQLLLFRKHFTLMNALYQLQDIYWHQHNRHLQISSLHIALAPENTSTQGQSPGEYCSQPLRDYYLDWDNFLNTSEQDIDELLSDFWRRFNQPQKRQQALLILGLKEGACEIEIAKRYRQLANQVHPDKGGNSDEFIKIREAYEILK